MNDKFKEHNLHDTYEAECSTCYSENRLIKSHGIVNRVEHLEKGWANSILNKIIWGDNKHFYN